MRAVATFVGIAAAVIGIIVAIAAAASVSTKSEVSLHWLHSHPDSAAAKAVEDDQVLRQDIDLEVLRVELIEAARTAGEAYEHLIEFGNPGNDAAKKAQAQQLTDEYTQRLGQLRHLQSIQRDVLDVASYTRVKSAFEGARRAMLIGALVAAAGITAFAWGVNSPTEPSIDPGEVLPKTPSDVTVILTSAGTTTWQNKLGKHCDTSAVAAVAFAVSGTNYDVVSVKTKDCRVARLVVSPDRGVVVPRVVSETSPTTTAAE